MNPIRRVALPCGIIGGILALVSPVFVLFISPTWVPERIWWYLPLLGLVTFMGVVSLVAILLRDKWFSLTRILIWISVAAIILVSFLGLSTWGVFFLPASLLLLLAAIGMRPKQLGLG